MIDVHAHVLPGLDDGAADMETALAMCRMAYEDGTRAIVATPHFYRGIFPTPSVSHCAELRAELQERCREAFDPEFRILAGSDCHVHAEIVDNLRAGAAPTVNGGRYLMIELPDRRVPPALEGLLFELRLAGIRPVITHPERHAELAADLDLLQHLLEQGNFAQVTAGSLTGAWGPEIRDVAERMLQRHLVQVIASDTHDIRDRPPILSAARDAAARLVGEELARQMVEDVPAAMIESRDFEFPAPQSDPGSSARRGRPLWRRLLGI